MNIVILTSSEPRHIFFRKYLALQKSFRVLKTYSETQVSSLREVVEKDDHRNLRAAHLNSRTQAERDFFELFNENTPDFSNNQSIKKGEINDTAVTRDLNKRNPDLIISYGCSIIKRDLIAAFPNRFINIHLGLSPYYRGAGTNYWPFVNNEPEYAGVTFMYIDEGIDTGAVIHQIRPVIDPLDNIHQVGNRLIKDMAKICVEIITNYSKLEPLHHRDDLEFNEKYYKTNDFTEESVKKMIANFNNGMLRNYLAEKKKRDEKVPILTSSHL